MNFACFKRRGVAACALILTSYLAPAIHAQPADPPPPPPERTPAERLQRLEDRFEALERRYAEELKSRDAEIDLLRAQLQNRPATQPATQPSPPPAKTVDEKHHHHDKHVESHDHEPFSLRTPAGFNPDISVISDFTASYSSNRRNDALNRMDVRELELHLRAAIGPRADAVAILSFERDAENPVFPEGEPLEGPESSVSIEEAYLNLHDFGVPNLRAKVGRFHVHFGRQNLLHLHQLPTSDPPLVNQAFLAPEALIDAGVSLSYQIPPEFIGGQKIEVTGEVLAGEGAGSESATLTGDITVDSPAFNLHARWNRDVTTEWNLEVGGSFLTGPRGADDGDRADLYGVDFTFIRRDPAGGFHTTLLQSEIMFGDLDQEEGASERAFGAYVLAQQQLSRDWFVGLRLDYTQDPNDQDREAYALSPYVSWYWGEDLRFRVQYQYKAGDVPTENNVYFQLTWIFGAHPPHPH